MSNLCKHCKRYRVESLQDICVICDGIPNNAPNPCYLCSSFKSNDKNYPCTECVKYSHYDEIAALKYHNKDNILLIKSIINYLTKTSLK